MELTFLGTGTSHGIPVLTCDCPVCNSGKTHNMRLRSSLFIRSIKCNLLIDTATEFRIQAVRENIKKIDAVLYTHSHADHLHGIDDVRPYSVKKKIPIYGSDDVIEDIEKRFPYIFNKTVQKGGGKPNLITNRLQGSFKIGDLNITPVPIKHGELDITGYRINNIAYLTDCSGIPEQSYPLLEDLDILIIGALRYRPHSTHFNIEQAAEEVKKIAPKRAYFTHICHDVDHYQLTEELKGQKIKPAHDGLCLKSD